MKPGDSLGPYHVLAKLGEGGMGEVYRARDPKLNRDVAIKVLPPLFVSDPDPSTSSGSPRASSRGDRLARFEREAQILASLNHPNIAHVYGVIEDRTWFGRPSPDGRWLSFSEFSAEGKATMTIAPLTPGTVSAESTWIRVTDGQSVDEESVWSADGRTLLRLVARRLSLHLCRRVRSVGEAADRDGGRAPHARQPAAHSADLQQSQPD
jgi:hypothetical protein